MERFEAVIVGLGPAGLAAAAELGRLGVRMAVVDENPEPGGQVYRRPSPGFLITNPRFLGRKQRQGERLIKEFNEVRDQCAVFNDADVWGVFESRSLSLARGDDIFRIGFKKLLLAEGAMERPRPFPNWTLPGILTLGGLHKLVVQERTLPGRDFLLAGRSPLLVPVAASIIKAGGRVAAICDPVPARRYLKLALEFLKRRELAREAWSYLYPVIKNGTPILRPFSIVSAAGGSRVEEARVAALDRQGRPVPGSERRFQVDVVGVSDGFSPLGRLARLCGCDHVFDSRQRYWRPRTDDALRAGGSGIYLVGDSKGLGGRELAEVEGRLAALHIAAELGRLSNSELERRQGPLRRERERCRRYAAVLRDVYAHDDSLDLSDKDLVVCRCEGVTVGDLEAGLDMGYRNINEMKRTRLGMGPCQGRTCESIAAALMLQKGLPIEEIGYLNPRPPLRPLPFFMLEKFAAAGRKTEK
ncbi:MAG: (2Fe-2S)-binding protein [Pseudomonadota bacterium]